MSSSSSFSSSSSSTQNLHVAKNPLLLRPPLLSYFPFHFFSSLSLLHTDSCARKPDTTSYNHPSNLLPFPSSIPPSSHALDSCAFRPDSKGGSAKAADEEAAPETEEEEEEEVAGLGESFTVPDK